MKISIIIGISLIWIVGSYLYFHYKNNKTKIITKAIIEGKNYNQFLPDESQIKDLTVNIVFDDKNMDTSQFCDLVIKAKDLINNNVPSISKFKNNMFYSEPESTQKEEEKKETTEGKNKLNEIKFNKYIKINQIKN